VSLLFGGQDSKGQSVIFAFLEQAFELPATLQEVATAFFSKNFPQKKFYVILPPSVSSTVEASEVEFLRHLRASKFIDDAYIDKCFILQMRYGSGITVFEKELDLNHWTLSTEERSVRPVWLLQEMRRGLQDLVLNSSALMPVRDGKQVLAHFEKPQGDHVSTFIRTANLFTHTCAPRFVATMILLELEFKCLRVLLDSSTILSLGICLQEQLAELYGVKRIPSVKIFESYRGLESLVDQDFENSVAIVSASSGGGLERELYALSTSFGPVFLFTCITIVVDVEASSKHYLVSLEDMGHSIETYSPQSCPLCRQGVPLITIASERFVPATRNQPSVLIYDPVLRDRKSHFSVVKSFFSKIVGTGSLGCFRNGSNDKIIPFYFRVNLKDPLLKKDVQVWLDAECRKYSRDRSKCVIVTWNDERSKALAELLRKSFEKISGRKARSTPILKFNGSESGQGLPKIDKDVYRVFIVQSASQTGKDILSFVSSLKQNHDQLRWHYFSLLSKGGSPIWIRQMKSNLASDYGSPHFHEVSVLWEVPMEAVGNTVRDSFRIELDLLRRILPKRGLDSRKMANRVKVLEILMSGGDFDKQRLFFSPRHSLRLANGLMFWRDDVDCSQCNHSDLLWTFHCVLHFFRLNGVLERSFSGLGFSTLSVRNFYRFYDGCAQAAILRTAYPSELNYFLSDEESVLLFDLIEFMLGNVSGVHSSGLYELLLALATRRMRCRLTGREGAIRDLAGRVGGIYDLLVAEWLG
jgi:hypothetical protein